MSLRKLDTFFNEATKRTAKIYIDREWHEYRVKFYRDGVYQENADYHTDMRDDARDTAINWVNSEA
jgi:hypothetical protein